MNSSSGRNPDPLEANYNTYQRAVLLKDHIKRLRKSPDTSRMYSIEIPALRITYYQKNLQLHKKRLAELKKLFPQDTLIINKNG